MDPKKLDDLTKDELLGLQAVRDMTLRQHYAGLAMQGLIADPAPAPEGIRSNPKERLKYFAKRACAYADALLAELAKGEG